MTKKIFFLISIMLILILLTVGLMLNNFFNGNKKELANTKQSVYEYLINEKGYKESDIKEIRPIYSWKDEKRNAYMAYVTFVDEPNNVYEYIYNEKEGIRERGTGSDSGKH